MAKHRDFAHLDKFFASWTDRLQEVLNGYASANFRLDVSGNSVRVPAGAGDDQVGVLIDGLWRYNTANADGAHPGGAAGIYDVLAVGSANDFVGAGSDPDDTDYTFGIQVKALGGAATGNHNGLPVTVSRLVGRCLWDGAALVSVHPILNAPPEVIKGAATSPWKRLASSQRWARLTNAHSGVIQNLAMGTPYADAIDGNAMAPVLVPIPDLVIPGRTLDIRALAVLAVGGTAPTGAPSPRIYSVTIGAPGAGVAPNVSRLTRLDTNINYAAPAANSRASYGTNPWNPNPETAATEVILAFNVATIAAGSILDVQMWLEYRYSSAP